MRKSILEIMTICSALLLGCQGRVNEVESDINVSVSEEEKKQDIIDSLETQEDWFALSSEEKDEIFGDNLNFYSEFKNKFGESYHDWYDRYYEEVIYPAEYEARLEYWTELGEQYAEEYSKKDYTVGFNMENFLKVVVGVTTYEEVNDMFGFEGTLVAESSRVKTYSWSKGSGKYYELVEIIFVDGKVSTKVQVGLD